MTFIPVFLHIRLSVLAASSHFSFPAMEQIVSPKVRGPEEQLENSVLRGRSVFRTFVLIQFEWEPEEDGADIMSYCLSFQNMLQIHQLLPIIYSQASIISYPDGYSGCLLYTSDAADECVNV